MLPGPMRRDDYLQRILTAKVYDVAVESALDPMAAMSRRLGQRVLLKREDQQPVFSFKLRGAYNKMAHLTARELARGVICASAGNHAQGVALAAQRLGTKAIVVMPTTTPRIKVAAVAARGAKVELFGDSYHEASLHAKALAKRRGLTFVHPYDDPLVIAGQGTIGMEILRQHQGFIDAIYVPVGGGGLIAGIASYVKRVSPKTRIVGVEPVDSNAMAASLAAGRRVTLEHVNLFADGVAVKQVGRETFRIARELVDEMVLVDTDEICAAIKDIFEDTRTVVEPSGALSLAGLKRHLERRRGAPDRTFVTIACGANMNFDRLRFVAERAELGEHREAVLAVTIPERPGSFRELCAFLGSRSVTEFNYRYAPEGEAHVFLGVAVSGREETRKLRRQLARHGMAATDLSDNELAKQHVRHLVGGRTQARDEMLYRFEFPERPGALMNFLNRMGTGWNISLFHYRNQGGDVGRVLVGLQVPEKGRTAFRRFLRELGYDYADETRNPAYRFFLR